MLALRYVGALAVAIWLGGLVVLGAISAPSIFEVIGVRGVPDGRLLSGAIFGEMFRRFHLVSYLCGVIVIGALLARAVLGPRPRRFAVRMSIAAGMLAASAYSGLVVSSAITRVQDGLGATAPSSLSADDPRRSEFGRLHALSAGIQLIPLLGGMMLLFWDTRE